MSQYDTRLLVKVKDTNDWSKLSNLSLMPYGIMDGFFEEYGKDNLSVYIPGGEWSCNESSLSELVDEISKRLPNCIVLADTHNYNVDPYNYCLYYFNENGDEIYVEGDEMWEIEMSDIFAWFEANEISLSDEEKVFLENF